MVGRCKLVILSCPPLAHFGSYTFSILSLNVLWSGKPHHRTWRDSFSLRKTILWKPTKVFVVVAGQFPSGLGREYQRGCGTESESSKDLLALDQRTGHSELFLPEPAVESIARVPVLGMDFCFEHYQNERPVSLPKLQHP
jgi:hypothetical protein